MDSIEAASPPMQGIPVIGKVIAEGQLFTPQERAVYIEYINVTTPPGSEDG